MSEGLTDRTMKFFRWRSVKTRVTLFTLAIFLFGMWSLAFNANPTLHSDMERVTGERVCADDHLTLG